MTRYMTHHDTYLLHLQKDVPVNVDELLSDPLHGGTGTLEYSNKNITLLQYIYSRYNTCTAETKCSWARTTILQYIFSR